MLRIWHYGYHVADVGSVEEVAEVLARHGLDLSFCAAQRPVPTGRRVCR